MRILNLIALAAGAAAICMAQTPPAPAEVPATPGLYAIFDTSQGQIVAELYEKQAPLTVKNFVDLAKGAKAARNKANVLVKRPYYNGLTFHRVIKGFMIQTGDVNASGSSDCGIHLKDEIDPTLKFDTVGRLAMANTGSPNTGGCQFFITVGKPMYLNGGYAIFGQVVAGQEIADKISQVPTSNEKPIVPVIIKSVTIQRKE
jgi:peptidyl-prolyl cis-trans isomerase A (cyclophilin A)